ncbi:MAG: nitroreductase family protein [Methanobacterium sp.]
MKSTENVTDHQIIPGHSVIIKINGDLCSACGTCLKVCPYDILIQGADGKPQSQAEENCVSCGHCAAVCPEGALMHEDFLENRIKLINSVMCPNSDQTMHLLRSRRSIRAFESKPVEKELIELIIDGANTGPSPHNAHRVEYVVVQDIETRNNIIKTVAEFYGKSIFLMKNKDTLEKMPKGIQKRINAAKHQLNDMERQFNRIRINNDILQRGTPSLLILHAPETSNDPFEPKIDATIALQNASLVCSSMGLGSCELGYIEIISSRSPEIKNLLDIPENHAIYGIMAIGYPAYTFKNWIEKSSAKVTWK